MIYLDNSATTRLDEEVLESMLPWLGDDYGNASSAHYMGRRSRVAVESAREEIASLMNAHPAEVIFTSGGTESNNTILKSCVQESALCTSIACSSIEHHAVLYPCDQLVLVGVDIHRIDVDTDGFFDQEALKRFNSAKTLVSIMHANNETGAVQSLTAAREIACDALLHTDAVQSFGKIEFDVQKLGVDFASFSAHKIHGPKGVGAMFIRKGIDFKAHQQGGGQERNRRAGTESVALIVGFQHAARKAIAKMSEISAICKNNISVFHDVLVASIPNIRFNTPQHSALPNIINVSFLDAEKLDGDAIIQLMDVHGVACSNGSACVSGTMQASHVLSAMGRSMAEATAAIRISVSKYSSQDDVLQAARLLSDIVQDMRANNQKNT